MQTHWQIYSGLFLAFQGFLSFNEGMKLTLSIAVLTLMLVLLAPVSHAACEDTATTLLQAQQIHQRYLKSRIQVDFYKTQKLYESVLTCDPKNRKAYEKLIELLLKRPGGLAPDLSNYQSSYDTGSSPLTSAQRRRSNARPVQAYRPDAYRSPNNPLLAIDALVERAYAIMKADPIKYDRKWLAKQYLVLVQTMLDAKPNNPSPALDFAYQLLEHAYDLDRSNLQIQNLRSSFRKR